MDYDTNFIWIDNELLGDKPYHLDRLIATLEKLQKKYGTRSVIKFDAGANNVGVKIKPSSKKARKTYAQSNDQSL